jgi:hypothetical protein
MRRSTGPELEKMQSIFDLRRVRSSSVPTLSGRSPAAMAPPKKICTVCPKDVRSMRKSPMGIFEMRLSSGVRLSYGQEHEHSQGRSIFDLRISTGPDLEKAVGLRSIFDYCRLRLAMGVRRTAGAGEDAPHLRQLLDSPVKSRYAVVQQYLKSTDEQYQWKCRCAGVPLLFRERDIRSRIPIRSLIRSRGTIACAPGYT